MFRKFNLSFGWQNPGERLLQFLTDNDAMFKAMLKVKEQLKKEKLS